METSGSKAKSGQKSFTSGLARAVESYPPHGFQATFRPETRSVRHLVHSPPLCPLQPPVAHRKLCRLGFLRQPGRARQWCCLLQSSAARSAARSSAIPYLQCVIGNCVGEDFFVSLVEPGRCCWNRSWRSIAPLCGLSEALDYFTRGKGSILQTCKTARLRAHGLRSAARECWIQGCARGKH